MIGNVRPWSFAIPEDKNYSEYLLNRSVLFDKLPISHSAYLLLRKIFSTRPELRPSLAAIRAEVVAMDTFFLSDEEAIGCGWVERLDKQMQRKIRARGAAAPPSRRSSKIPAGSDCFETCTLGSSSASRYSTGASTSAFDSSSAKSSDMPATPRAPVAEVLRTMEKEKAGRLLAVPRVVAAQTL